MIIVGYQGIGKSTLAKESSRFIDLESGNFWVDGERPDNWYMMYCNIANHLSKQGYNVFVSSHQVVRDCLKSSDEKKVIVCPSTGLKDEWIKRLQERYDQSGLEKDYKALMNAKDRYTENITELLIDDAFIHVIINSMDYDLQELISQVECRQKIKNVEAWCRVNDAQQAILNMYGSDQLKKNIETCAFDNEIDFKNGVSFGMALAALNIGAYVPRIYAPVYDSSKEESL